MNESGSKIRKIENGGLKNHQFRVHKMGNIFSDTDTFIFRSGNAIIRDGLRMRNNFTPFLRVNPHVGLDTTPTNDNDNNKRKLPLDLSNRCVLWVRVRHLRL